MTYHCTKCKREVQGGFNPTGFCFGDPKDDIVMCRPCYEEYWKGFNKFEKEYNNKFFKLEGGASMSIYDASESKPYKMTQENFEFVFQCAYQVIYSDESDDDIFGKAYNLQKFKDLILEKTEIDG